MPLAGSRLTKIYAIVWRHWATISQYIEIQFSMHFAIVMFPIIAKFCFTSSSVPDLESNFMVRAFTTRDNKANLRDFIAATGLVILLELDWNRRFFRPCDIKLWWMTSQNYRTPLLHYIKLCASSQTPRLIQTGVTVRKRPIRVKISNFLSHVT